MKKAICFVISMLLCILFAVPVMAEPDVDQELEAIRNARIGDIVIFGVYEQDNNLDNGQEPIEWEVLDIQDGKALLISKYALDCQPYNEEYTYVTWETCTLREWLNQEFLDTAFSPAEATAIAETAVVNNDNRTYVTEGGNDTTDKIFLLSRDEVEQYYEIVRDAFHLANDSLVCKLTDYGKERIISNYMEHYDGTREEAEEWYHGTEESWGENACWWWLRSPGNNSDYAAYVYFAGNDNYYGYYVADSIGAVRPAFWINQ